MKMLSLVPAAAAALVIPFCVSIADDGIWQGVNASWADTANWVDGTPPSNGGTVYLSRINATTVTTFSNDIPGLTLGGIVASNAVDWVISGASLPFAFPLDPASTSRVEVSANALRINPPLGDGTGVLHMDGTGLLALYTPALFTGSWLVTSGRVEIVSAEALLAPPPALVPDAITLDGGGIKNNGDNSSPVFPPTMGITLGPAGGHFVIGWNDQRTITYQSPITGPGALTIAFNNGRHLLQNPANDYAGGTIVGTRPSGWYDSNYAYLQLDADGVLPYGPGKGGLTIIGADKGRVDTVGHSNRVTSLTATAGSILTNSVPGQGALYVDAVAAFSGNLRPGARIVWCGPGAFNFAIPDGAGRGEIRLADDLPLSAPFGLGGASLILDGQNLAVTPGPGAETLVSTNSGLFLIGPDGAALNATGPAPLPPLVLRSGIAEAPGNLAHAPLTLNTSLIIDGPAAYPARFDAELALPQDASVTLRGSIWLARLPPADQWAAAPGAALYPIGAAAAIAVANPAAFDGCTLHIVNDNLAAFPTPITVTGNPRIVLDTFSPSGDVPLAAAHDIVLSGGTLGLAGSAAVTLSGAISGPGGIVKTGAGTATLSGANTFTGSITVSNGTLAAATSAALGTGPVTLAGGRLANTNGAAITLTQPVTVLTTNSGFTVNGGSITLAGGLDLPTGTLNKQGAGELIINGAAFTPPASLTLSGGAVVLDIPTGTTNTIQTLLGTGDLIKRGGGTLIANPAAAYTGRIVLDAGTLMPPTFPPPAPDPVLWLDASNAASLTLDLSDGVTAWRDTREPTASATNYPYAWLNTGIPNDNSPGLKAANPPTLLASALAGRPALDFGAYRSGRWLAIANVPTARTFFWVIGSQTGGGHLIGAPDRGLCRGYTPGGSNDIESENSVRFNNPLWNNGSWNADAVRNSQNWTNGVSVTGTSTGLSGNWDMVATIASESFPLAGLQKDTRTFSGGQGDNTGRSGGGRIAEFIVYDRVLTTEERQATEAYLRAKWFTAVISTVWNTEVAVTGSSTLALPSAASALRLSRLTGAAPLAKTGPGALTVEAPEAFTGTLTLTEGTFSADGPNALLTKYAAPANPVPGAAFWVDASAPGTFGKDANNRVFWRDARWQDPGDWNVATQRWTYAPTILSNAVGNLPVIDLGPLNSPSGLQWDHPVSNLTAVFWVIGSQAGGGTLLGGDDNDNPFNRGVNSPSASTPIWHSSNAHANIRNGTTRIDGIRVTGTSTGLNGSYQVIALRTANNGAGVFAGQFAHDRELSATSTRHGAQRLGEVLVFTNTLTDVEFAAVEAYLMNKWQRPYTRGITATLRALDVTAGPGADAHPPTVSVDSRTLAVGDLTGPGPLLRKTGDATLAVSRYGLFAGELELAAGHATFTGKTGYRYIRLTVNAIRGPNGNNENMQRTSLGDLHLLKNGVKVPWPAGTVATGSVCLDQSGTFYGPARLMDGANGGSSRWITLTVPAWAQFDLLAPTEFDAYRLYTADASGYHYRDPTDWTFEASHDGVAWETLDAKTSQSYTAAEGFLLGPYPVAGNGGNGISDMTLTLKPGTTAAFAPGAHTLTALGGIGGITGGALTVSGLNLVTSAGPADALRIANALTVTDPAALTLTVQPGAAIVAPVIAEAGAAFNGSGTLTIANAAALATGEHQLATGVTVFAPAGWSIWSDDPLRAYSLTRIADTLLLRINPKGTLILLR